MGRDLLPQLAVSEADENRNRVMGESLSLVYELMDPDDSRPVVSQSSSDNGQVGIVGLGGSSARPEVTYFVTPKDADGWPRLEAFVTIVEADTIRICDVYSSRFDNNPLPYAISVAKLVIARR